MAIDTSDTKNSLFGGLKKSVGHSIATNNPSSEKPEQLQSKCATEVNLPIQTNNPPQTEQTQPKWQTFDKVTTLLTSEQKEGLDRIAKKLMKFRVKALKGESDKERITANTLIRALIENFLKLENSLQLEVLITEDEVKAWIQKALK